MEVVIGSVKTVERYETHDKEQAVKVLEEAAELVEACKAYNGASGDIEETDHLQASLIFECCDVIIATAHLLAGLGVYDARVAIAIKQAKNESRWTDDPGEGLRLQEQEGVPLWADDGN